MKILLITTILFLIPAYSYAQTETSYAEDEKQIQQIVENIYTAWAEGDGVKYADNFTDDVDYTVWNGIQFKGRESNIKNHQMIFDTFYKGTEVKFEITKLRFLTEDVAVVHFKGRLYKDGKLYENTPPVVPVAILKKQNGKWRIAVFQNTPVIQRGELVVGRGGESKGEIK